MLLQLYPTFIQREHYLPKLSRPFFSPTINPTRLCIPPPPPISRPRSSPLHSPAIPPNTHRGQRRDTLRRQPRLRGALPELPRLSLGGESPHLKVKKLSENSVLPSRASPLSVGYDLSSAVETKVPARGKALVPTDLSIAIPEGTYARVAPRSGLAWKHSIDVGAGVIDADYRGPVGVVLFNHSDVDFEVKQGERIEQLIIERIMTPDVAEVDGLDPTVRGDGGFGSTGV